MRRGPVNRFRAAVLGLLVFALALAACGGGDDGARAQVKRPATTTAPRTTTTTTTVPPTTTTAVPDYITYSATVKPTVTNIGVFASPADPQPSQTFPNPWLYDASNPATGVPQTFLVKSQRPDGWVEVLLPVRPNGSTGWVHSQRGDARAEPLPHRGVARRAHDHCDQRGTT